MSYRVVDLKEELEKRGLSKAGAKKELVARLEEYILANEAESVENSGESDGQNEEDKPPEVQIEANLEENDIIKEYMMMRQSQFQSAMEEKSKEPAPESKNDDEEDAPLSKGKSPRKRRGRGASSSVSESEDSVKSPRAARGMRSPLSEAVSPKPEVEKVEIQDN